MTIIFLSWMPFVAFAMALAIFVANVSASFLTNFPAIEVAILFATPLEAIADTFALILLCRRVSAPFAS